MPNPKDTKEKLVCVACGFISPCACVTLFRDQYPLKHYPGCHKVHLECANKIIEEARRIFQYYVQSAIEELDDMSEEKCWLKSLGEK